MILQELVVHPVSLLNFQPTVEWSTDILILLTSWTSDTLDCPSNHLDTGRRKSFYSHIFMTFVKKESSPPDIRCFSFQVLLLSLDPHTRLLLKKWKLCFEVSPISAICRLPVRSCCVWSALNARENVTKLCNLVIYKKLISDFSLIIFYVCIIPTRDFFLLPTIQRCHLSP